MQTDGFTTLISTENLFNNLGVGDWRVVDCRFSLMDTERGRSDFRKRHIPGAVYAHLDEDLSGDVIKGGTGRHPLPPPDEFVSRLENWGISNESQVVVYDDFSGAIAARLWWMLNWLGHSKVAVLDGGWPKWIAEERPVALRSEQVSTGRFRPRVSSQMLATTEEVNQIRNDSTFRLVDAREEKRFLGLEEPIDAVAGHIPGAVSKPFGSNLDSHGCFLPAEVLHSQYKELIGGTPPEKVVFYCGSGVTAAHNLVAMMHAGLGMAKIYGGSWSEWINHRELPICQKKA